MKLNLNLEIILNVKFGSEFHQSCECYIIYFNFPISFRHSRINLGIKNLIAINTPNFRRSKSQILKQKFYGWWIVEEENCYGP
jgi:hypothetical protein